jgi:hypothetical protein
MKANAPIYSLNGGEVSKIALTRVDVAKMRMAAACQVNWLPWVLGPMSLRPGMYYVGEIDDDNSARVLPFVYSKLDTALMEFTAGTLRIWINEALLTRPSVATTILDPFFQGLGDWTTGNTTAGASATIAGSCILSCAPVGGLAQVQQSAVVAAADQGKEHGIRIVIGNGPVTFRAGSTLGASDLIGQTVLDTGTHSLSCVPGAALCIQIESTDAWNKIITQCSIEPAGIVTLPVPYTASDLPNLRIDQSGDEVFVACYGQQQRIVERRGTNPGGRGWSVVLYRSGDGPFQSAPGIQANFTPGAYYGNTTLTSDRPWFQPGHVGALFRLFSNGQFNQTVLGNQNAFTPAVRVTGVGATRNYSWNTSGTWSGTLTFQRSYDANNSGFIDVSTVTANGSPTFSSSTGGMGGTPDLDNVIAWERVGFKGGNYVSGDVTASSTYAGGGGYGICRVTGYNSPTSVNIEVLVPFSSLAATTDWVESEWSGVAGWPDSVVFHEGRLVWLGANQIWLSASDNFTSFADINLDGSPTGDGGAINSVCGSGPVDTIAWGLSLTRLLAGREQSVESIRSDNFDSPLTPTAFVARTCSDQGAERLAAIKAGKRGIFVQQSGRKVYELFFNAQEMDYDDRDLTRLNLDIGSTGFVDIAKQVQPDTQIWLPRGDGQAACLLYDVKDDVECWWRVMTLGVIENVCVLPQAGFEDLVYFVVRRVVSGVTRRFIERLSPRENCVGGAINQQLDCHVVYQGAPTGTITLAQLPNTLVSVWADGLSIGSGTTNGSGVLTLPDGQNHSNIVAGLAGAVVTVSEPTYGAPQNSFTVGTQYNGYPAECFADVGGTGEPIHLGSLVVSGGAITIPNGQNASSLTACLGYVAPFLSAKLAYGAQLGSALTMRKRIDHLGLVMYDTHFQGVQHGQRIDHLDPLPLVEDEQTTPNGTVWNEYDEPMLEVPGDWRTDSRLCLLGQAPLPCMIGGVVIAITTNERG